MSVARLRERAVGRIPLRGAGVVNFTATQTGNGNYTAAPPVNFSVTRRAGVADDQRWDAADADLWWRGV